MASAIFALDIIITLAITVWVLREYGNLRRSWAVTLTVIVAWFFSFSIVLILPLDVSSTWYLDCTRNYYCAQPNVANQTLMGTWCTDIDYSQTAETISTQACMDSPDCPCSPPVSYVSQKTLPDYWAVTYWTSQALTWLLLPIMESYMSAGDFTPGRKMVSALKEYAIINSIFAVIGFSFLIYIAVRNNLDMNGLKSVVIALTNMTGLIFVMVFLGYGVVDLPRKWFRKYNLQHSLKSLQFRAGSLNIELHEAEEKVNELVAKLKDLHGMIPQRDELRPYLNKILERVPSLRNEGSYDDYKENDDAMPTLSTLANLNKKLMKAQNIEARCRCLWADLMDTALELEDVIENRDSPTRRYVSKYFPNKQARFPFLGNHLPMLQWYWKIWLQPIGYILLGTCGTLLSMAVIWSEVTFSTNFSIYAQLISQAGKNHQHFLLEVVTFITLCYMCLCCYRIVFNLRLFNFYYLVPKQQTDSSSLLYSGTAFCRMTVPLCLNFLAMCHLDNHVTKGNTIGVETAFTVVMGHMDVLDWLNNFALYYPIIVIPVGLCTLFNVHTRILSALGVHSALIDDSGAEDLVQEGTSLINLEKSRRGRGDMSGPIRGGQNPGSTAPTADRGRDRDGDSPMVGRAPIASAPAASGSSRAKPAATRLQQFLNDFQTRGGAAASASSKSVASKKPASESSRRAMTVSTEGIGSYRKLFSAAHDEDEIELLPTHDPDSQPAARSSQRSKNNFFD